MTRITDRQAEILRFVIDTIARDQRSPSLVEIGARFDIGSTNGVVDHLRSLERKGFIVRATKKSRAIRVVCDEHGVAMRLRWERVE